jgi:hypothetical protein
LAASATEQTCLRFLDYVELSLIGTYAQLVKSGFASLFEGLSGDFHPFHQYFFFLRQATALCSWRTTGFLAISSAGIIDGSTLLLIRRFRTR